MKTVLSFLGKIWALPTTIVFGLPFGLLGACLAPREIRIGIGHNAICFYNHPLLRGDARAVTLGNVIAFQKEGRDFKITPELCEHERQHTLQAEMLGIFYVPLYLILMPKYRRSSLHPMERGPWAKPPRPW